MRWCDPHPVLLMECLELYTDICGKQVCTTRYKKNRSNVINQESSSLKSSVDGSSGRLS